MKCKRASAHVVPRVLAKVHRDTLKVTKCSKEAAVVCGLHGKDQHLRCSCLDLAAPRRLQRIRALGNLLRTSQKL